MAKHHLDRCVDVPSFTWCNVCIHIMDELSLVIDCLCFFFLFSLLRTKVHNYPLFVYCLLLFVYCLLGSNSQLSFVCLLFAWVWHDCQIQET
jgi:hypothetical protein